MCRKSCQSTSNLALSPQYSLGSARMKSIRPYTYRLLAILRDVLALERHETQDEFSFRSRKIISWHVRQRQQSCADTAMRYLCRYLAHPLLVLASPPRHHLAYLRLAPASLLYHQVLLHPVFVALASIQASTQACLRQNQASCPQQHLTRSINLSVPFFKSINALCGHSILTWGPTARKISRPRCPWPPSRRASAICWGTSYEISSQKKNEITAHANVISSQFHREVVQGLRPLRSPALRLLAQGSHLQGLVYRDATLVSFRHTFLALPLAGQGSCLRADDTTQRDGTFPSQ